MLPQVRLKRLIPPNRIVQRLDDLLVIIINVKINVALSENA